MKATLSIQRYSVGSLQMASKIRPIQSSNYWLQELDKAIEQHLSNYKVLISSLASALFMSERQFFRRIKQQTGKTPNEYIRLYRLQKARKLLLSGQVKSLKEVSQQIGYRRVDYFSNLFKAQFGIKPLYLINNDAIRSK